MRITRAWILPLFPLAFAAFVAACGDDPVTPPPTGASSSTGNAGGSGGAGGGAAGMGGMGGMPECSVAADCTQQGVANECGEPACEMGKCVRKLLQPAGMPLASQTYGDCVERQCDDKGDIVDAALDTDAFNDGNDCTMDVCTNGVLSHDVAIEGAACGAAGACDMTGQCVQCIPVLKDCAMPKVCIAGFCAGAKCDNMMKDAGEGDVDCGGSCAPCDDAKTCTLANQCKSGVCAGGLCVAPSCLDTVQNGNETSPDCGGGGDCMPCPTDAVCFATTDCQSGVCVENFCIAPTCKDSVQNGDEAGIDCGGAACAACP